ncbi:MAG: twin-arginine translocase subunit TatC [Tatlockia sp.]|nr:twin-arginine translocase subunit TatC [Tatlockia sp.]
MLSHLLELRRRALYVVLIFFSLFLLFFFKANELFHALVNPLLQALPEPNLLIATQITAPVLTPIKLAADAAMLCSAPFALLQLWLFMSPGLYRQERSQLKTAVISILLLFCTGVLFCFYLVLPLMFQFFAKATPLGVRLMPDINYALDFITRMLLLFGLCFQIPILCLALVHLKWVNLQHLKKIRPYIIVAAFIVGMFLTPDILSQIILAIPLCLLYELGIILSTLKGDKNQIRL